MIWIDLKDKIKTNKPTTTTKTNKKGTILEQAKKAFSELRNTISMKLFVVVLFYFLLLKIKIASTMQKRDQ